MASLGGKLYGVSVKSQNAVNGKSQTKSVNGINIPVLTTENEASVAADLRAFCQLLNELGGNIFNTAELTSKREVNS